MYAALADMPLLLCLLVCLLLQVKPVGPEAMPLTQLVQEVAVVP
jgi:hypothetical protein